MLKEMTNLLKGEVTARVESGFPERVLNLCGEYGLTFWDLRWENAAAFTFTQLEALEKKPDQTDRQFQEELELLRDIWRERLAAEGTEFYR